MKGSARGTLIHPVITVHQCYRNPEADFDLVVTRVSVLVMNQSRLLQTLHSIRVSSLNRGRIQHRHDACPSDSDPPKKNHMSRRVLFFKNS